MRREEKTLCEGKMGKVQAGNLVSAVIVLVAHSLTWLTTTAAYCNSIKSEHADMINTFLDSVCDVHCR